MPPPDVHDSKCTEMISPTPITNVATTAQKKDRHMVFCGKYELAT
jgi:hypothetical protein